MDSGCEDSVFYALVLTLAVFGVLSIAIAAPFYLYATTLDAAKRSRVFTTR